MHARFFRSLVPRTLMGQMILILLTGLAASHLVANWIYASDRGQALRAVGGYAVAQRIAHLARLVDEAPEDWRSRIVTAASDPTLRVTLSLKPPETAAKSFDATEIPIGTYLAEQLPDALSARFHIYVAGPSGARTSNAVNPNAKTGPWRHRVGQWRGLHAVIQLTNGQYLSFVAALPETGPSISWRFIGALGVMSILVVLTSIWAVRRVTAPLGIVVQAAQRLGRDVDAPPIAGSGSREMQEVAQAFNEMQLRLQRLLQGRTTMLAALSHDLRTPLTLLRLRIEGLPEGEERDRMLASVGDLDAMIETTLQFARGEAAAEGHRRTDLGALLSSIVDDMADAGLPVTMEPSPAVVLACQPITLRRAIINLIDNAIKYGNTAHVTLLVSESAVSIVVEDEGPGIPESERQSVFEPFHRLEQSRNRETGGTGLGLAIALSIARAHGGQIVLRNRATAGLCATLILPR